MRKIQKSIDEFFNDALTCNINLSENDRNGYPAVINFFKNIQVFTKENLIQGFYMVYSFMPTIGDISNTNYQECTKIINNVKNHIFPSNSDLNNLSSLTNNSLVGASKLLHFINPDMIPIFDSRVCRYLVKGNPGNLVTKTDFFIQYVDFCESVISHKEFDIIRKKVSHIFQYKISDLRICEFIMYLEGHR